MSSPVYISLLDTAKLELAGAEQRLATARQNYRAFAEEHGTIIDGLFIYSPAPSPQMRVSLDDERDSLECELDEAHRRVAHCSEVVADLQLCSAVEDDTVSDLVLGLPQEADEESDG
jgi:hypothetical protein